jgi:hypothetical protein
MAGIRRFDTCGDIAASWFETRGLAALLTMRVSDLILSRREAPSRRMHAPLSPRHCERSEAKRSIARHKERMDCLRFARNDGGYSFAFSRRISPEVCISFALQNLEGAGKTGCLLHPRSRVRFALTKLHTSIQGSGNTPAFPAQWLYGLLRALPGERLFCLRRRRDTSRQLSASTAAPEPHDFAVRLSHTRQSQPSASIASHRTFVTMANAPHLP